MGKRSYLKVGGTISAGRVSFCASAIEGVGIWREVEITGTVDARPFKYLVPAGQQIEPLPGYRLRIDRITENGRIEFEAFAPWEHIRVQSQAIKARPAGRT